MVVSCCRTGRPPVVYAHGLCVKHCGAQATGPTVLPPLLPYIIAQCSLCRRLRSFDGKLSSVADGCDCPCLCRQASMYAQHLMVYQQPQSVSVLSNVTHCCCRQQGQALMLDVMDRLHSSKACGCFRQLFALCCCVPQRHCWLPPQPPCPGLLACCGTVCIPNRTPVHFGI